MLAEDRLGNASQERPHSHRQNEDVVDLPEQGYPVRNDVEGDGEVASDRYKTTAHEARNTIVPDDPPQQTQDVRKRENEIAC